MNNNKYYISFNSSAGSRAVEKELYKYIRENYMDCLVSEEGINGIVTDLRNQQEEYLRLQRGALPVRVELSRYSLNDRTCFIHVGQMCMTLIRIRKGIHLGKEDAYVDALVEELKKEK